MAIHTKLARGFHDGVTTVPYWTDHLRKRRPLAVGTELPHVGLPGTGVTMTDVQDGNHHTTTLTFDITDASGLVTGDNVALSTGYLVFTFPPGEIVVECSHISIGLTVTAEQAADTPDVGLGTVIGTGAVATLDGTATFEDIMTGAAGTTAGVHMIRTAFPTAANKFLVAAASAHTVHFNMADTWADDTSADLTCDLEGTVVLVWRWLGTGI